jgi:hypothetical protein
MALKSGSVASRRFGKSREFEKRTKDGLYEMANKVSKEGRPKNGIIFMNGKAVLVEMKVVEFPKTVLP